MNTATQHHFTKSDRDAITAMHAEGAARALFGSLEFISEDGADLAVISSADGAPALVVSRQTLDGVYLVTRGLRVLAAGDKFKPVASALHTVAAPRKRRTQAA